MPTLQQQLQRGSQGGLFQEEQSLKDRVQQLGLPTPTSPSGAASVGATPKQQDMAGTPLQKQAVIQETVAKEDTLSATERLDQPRQEATTAEGSAKQKADQLRQLGSLGTRVQSLIEQRLNQASQGQLGQTGAAEDRVGQILGLTADQRTIQAQDPSSSYSQALAALQTLSAAPSGPEAEAAYVTLSNLGVAPATAQQLIDTGVTATGQQVAANVQDSITMGELDLTQLGFEDMDHVADLLGIDPEAAGTMSLGDFQRQVEGLRQQELARIQNLRAQLAAAPAGSARHQQLMRELGDLAQVGVTGSEDLVDAAIEDLSTADSVEVAGREFKVEDLLKDENISQIIVDFLRADPEQQDKLLDPEKFADLRAWIEDNQTALAQLSSDLTESAQDFGQLQDDWQSLTQLDDDLNITGALLEKLIGWDPDQAVTSEDLAAAREALAASPVGQLAFDESYAAVRNEIIDKLNEDNIDQLADLTPDEIVTAHQYAALANDPAYQTILGLDRQDFVADQLTQQAIEEYRDAVDEMKKAGVTDQWLRDDNFKDLPPDQMLALAQNPGQFSEFQKYNQIRDQVAQAETLEDVLSIMGINVNPADLQREYAELQHMAKVGIPGAEDRLAVFQQVLDADGDGKLSNDDVGSLLDRIQGYLSEDNKEAIIDGASLHDVFKSFGDLADADVKTPFTSTLDPRNAGRYMALSKAMYDFLDDGRVTTSEILQLPPDLQKMVFDLAPGQPWAEGLPKSYEEFERDVAKTKATKTTNQLTREARDTIRGMASYVDAPDKNWSTGKMREDLAKWQAAIPQYEAAIRQLTALSRTGTSAQQAAYRAQLDRVNDQLRQAQRNVEALSRDVVAKEEDLKLTHIGNKISAWQAQDSSGQRAMLPQLHPEWGEIVAVARARGVHPYEVYNQYGGNMAVPKHY